MSRIITRNVYPPIPDRRFDWCAYHDDDEEIEEWYGWGATKAEALADLERIDQEREEYEEYKREIRDIK